MAQDRKAEKRKLDGLMGRAVHLRAEQKRARKRGSAMGSETAKRNLDAVYTQVREHCATHGLNVPKEVPAP